MLRIHQTLSFKDACPLYSPEEMESFTPDSRTYREVNIYFDGIEASEVSVLLNNINRDASEGGPCDIWESKRSFKYSVNEMLADGFSFDKSFTEENEGTLAMANSMLQSFVVSLRHLVTPSVISTTSKIVISSSIKDKDTFHELGKPWKVPRNLIVPRKYTTQDGSLIPNPTVTHHATVEAKSLSIIEQLNQNISDDNKKINTIAEAISVINNAVNNNQPQKNTYKTAKINLPSFFQELPPLDIVFVLHLLEKPFYCTNINTLLHLVLKKENYKIPYTEHQSSIYDQVKDIINKFTVDFETATEIYFPRINVAIGDGWERQEHKTQQADLRHAVLKHLAMFHPQCLIHQWKSPLTTANLYNKFFLKNDKGGLSTLFQNLSRRNLKKLLAQWTKLEFSYDPVLYLVADITYMVAHIEQELLRRNNKTA